MPICGHRQHGRGFASDDPRTRRDERSACVRLPRDLHAGSGVENTPNRAHYMLVTGIGHRDKKPFTLHPAKFSWCGQEVTLPNVPGAPAAQSIIATRGLDSAVRGLKKHGKRLDLAVIDDPDTEETVNSEEQAGKLEKRIDRAIAGLGGQRRPIARVMLTTIQRRTCVSAKFTDRQQKPSWHGRRFRFLLTPPSRPDLWDEYVQMRQQDHQAGDIHARRSHQFYIDRRGLMDAGAVVANENRYNPETLDDGTQREISALERYFNEVARIGQEAVSTEYDNDPPDEAGIQESGITAHRVQTQVGGYPRKVVPPECQIVTQGIDVRKIALHWVVRAWRLDDKGRLIHGYTIDYGVQEVYGTTIGSDEGLDRALRRALEARHDAVKTAGYATAAGDERPIDMTLVDAGWRTEAIYDACQALGRGYLPSMGFGKSAGAVRANFTIPVEVTADRRPGHRWFLSRKPKGVWLACFDADYWKSYEHDRWMSDPTKADSFLLFGEASERSDKLSQDQKGHFSYSKHITSEIEVEEVIKGVLKRYWKAKSDTNHYLDASDMASVAASMKGLRIGVTGKSLPANQRPSMADLARRAG